MKIHRKISLPPSLQTITNRYPVNVIIHLLLSAIILFFVIIPLVQKLIFSHTQIELYEEGIVLEGQAQQEQLQRSQDLESLDTSTILSSAILSEDQIITFVETIKQIGE